MHREMEQLEGEQDLMSQAKGQHDDIRCPGCGATTGGRQGSLPGGQDLHLRGGSPPREGKEAPMNSGARHQGSHRAGDVAILRNELKELNGQADAALASAKAVEASFKSALSSVERARTFATTDKVGPTAIAISDGGKKRCAAGRRAAACDNAIAAATACYI
mmetsp:Transcript_37197/g.104973  ORF Transcript_37197/g.104973 Transcript_37197/m.104973 type:complete len:162 (+) Transcript_37197:351-836(+)